MSQAPVTPTSQPTTPPSTPDLSTPNASSNPPAAAAPATPADSFLADPPAAAAPPADASFAAASDDVEEIEYELELADDSIVPDEDFEELVKEAKEKGLSKEEASARLALMDKAFKKAKDSYIASEGKRLLGELLQDEMFNTPEKQKAAKAHIDQVYAAYKDPDFMKFVKGNPTVGSNKHFVKFLVELGKSVRAESQPPGQGNSGNPSTPAKKEGTTALDLYPGMKDN